VRVGCELKRLSETLGIELFEVPLQAGWTYPCSLDDIGEVLARIDRADLVGLAKVGLGPSTRKRNSTNGRYVYEPGGSSITLYSFADNLEYSYRNGRRIEQLRQWYYRELMYGMQLDVEGGRVRLKWSAEDLRLFISRHVLLHEVGHHVHQMSRVRRGLAPADASNFSEQLAEHYACRMTAMLFAGCG